VWPFRAVFAKAQCARSLFIVYARCLVEDQTMAEADPFDNVLFFLSQNLDEEDRQELIPAIKVRV